jgi:hypothetical protein
MSHWRTPTNFNPDPWHGDEVSRRMAHDEHILVFATVMTVTMVIVAVGLLVL